MHTRASLRACRIGCVSTVVALLLIVAGCASRPQDTLAPVVETSPKASEVTILAATTRASSPSKGVLFSGERGDELSLTSITVSIPPDRATGSIEWPRQLPGDPSRDFVTTDVTPVATNKVNGWLRENAKPGRRVLIFVHGFNTRFDEAVFRFAQIVHDSGASVEPVLFSWPSRGSLLNYNYDRESTNFSRSELAKVIMAAADSPNVSEITIMAHSMGAWPTVEALRDIALRRGKVPAKVTDVILASPDLDVDVFGKQLADIGTPRPHFTIFVSANDRALRASRLISGNVTRVGAVDLDREDYQQLLTRTSGVTVFDLSELRNGDRLNHSQFATSPEIVKLLGERLIDGQPIGVSDPGAPGHFSATAVDAGTTLGTATGVALTAPIRIFQAASGGH